MTKRAIPRVPPTPDAERRLFDEAVKENLERVSGLRGGKIKPLPAAASVSDVIDKINEILGRLQ